MVRAPLFRPRRPTFLYPACAEGSPCGDRDPATILRPMERFSRLAVALALAAAPAAAQVPARLGPAEFGALVERLSEPPGYFNTDNLISNEDSYLHAVTGLERYGVRGGAYLGVGPDQNFSYIAAVRPDIVFIIDIRRDNLLEQLLFKAL